MANLADELREAPKKEEQRRILKKENQCQRELMEQHKNDTIAFNMDAEKLQKRKHSFDYRPGRDNTPGMILIDDMDICSD